MGKMLLLALLLPATLLVTACTEVGYYVQCINGHWDIMRRCRPIGDLLADPSLPEARRTRLKNLQSARDFASASLGLPDNGSYRQFADVGRPYVVWNVVATPEFSLEPKQWCFPVAGCVSYRGYFDENAARREADLLADEGYEIDVYGVQAYSTLTWFDDPVLNTFVDGPELQAVALVFHELAHQVVYVANDSRFNEAFARTVELEGVRRWLTQNGAADDWQQYQEHGKKAKDFHDLLLHTRERLAELYAGSTPVAEKRRIKALILSGATQGYAELKLSWDGYAGYDPWMMQGLNNARLASIATYHDLVPAFQALLASLGGDLPSFYQSVKELAALPAAERVARLDGLTPMRQAKKL